MGIPKKLRIAQAKRHTDKKRGWATHTKRKRINTEMDRMGQKNFHTPPEQAIPGILHISEKGRGDIETEIANGEHKCDNN